MYSFTEVGRQLRVYWDLIAKEDLSRTKARPETCTKEGNIEYWTCGLCSRIYSDAEGKKKDNRKCVKKYKKIFTKKNCGRKVNFTL